MVSLNVSNSDEAMKSFQHTFERLSPQLQKAVNIAIGGDAVGMLQGAGTFLGNFFEDGTRVAEPAKGIMDRGHAAMLQAAQTEGIGFSGQN